MNIINLLPHINATFNALSALFLLTGFFFIKKKQVASHKKCMLLALSTSALFLVGYLTYHAIHGTTRFTEQGFVRTLYFTILISHTFLAVLIVPLVGRVLWFAYKQTFEKHKRLARWAFPIWLYVSVTGVLVYFFLYHWYPPTST